MNDDINIPWAADCAAGSLARWGIDDVPRMNPAAGSDWEEFEVQVCVAGESKTVTIAKKPEEEEENTR